MKLSDLMLIAAAALAACAFVSGTWEIGYRFAMAACSLMFLRELGQP